MAKSPTAKTLEYCRAANCDAVQKVEMWCPFSKKRKDLFGFIDVVAIFCGKIHGIQSTTRAHVGDRLNKIQTQCHDEALAWVHAGGVIMIHGWYKKGNRSLCKEVEVTKEMLM